MVTLVNLTVAEVATIINAVITVVNYTLGLSLVVVLVNVMDNVNSAISWSGVARRLHSSLWPTLLRADSVSARGVGPRVSLVSWLIVVGSFLIAVAGVVTPLGLRSSIAVSSSSSALNAFHVPDTSPIGLASSFREGYGYSRLCENRLGCPRTNDINTSKVPQSLIDTFSSTAQGPFNMQFRRYHQSSYANIDGGSPITIGTMSMLQSLVLRDDIFAVEGLIVDLSDSPGVGLWNHTLPHLQMGGSWTQDVLWLEPVSSCVNLNLTVDYQFPNQPFSGVNDFNLTDRGGFVNLTTQYPTYSRDGQNIDLYAHAYKGSVLTNWQAMLYRNLTTRNASYVGRTFPMNVSTSAVRPGTLQKLSPISLNPNGSPSNISTNVLCAGYGGLDESNITNVGVTCGLLLGPPQRSDGGDSRFQQVNLTWSQPIYYCASATRARMQTITFSFNGTLDIKDLQITRQNTNTPVLWAMEKTGYSVAELNPLWGRVADSYENDPALWTMRSEVFYVPAGVADIFGSLTDGIPLAIAGAAWSTVWSSVSPPAGFDYSGGGNYALLNKWQSNIQANPLNGPVKVINSIWTDILANNLMGTDTATTIFAVRYEPSVIYRLMYGIPALMLLVLWLPAFVYAVFVLLSGSVRLSHLRYLLDQTSVGRVAVGDSAFRVMGNSGQLQPS